MSQVLLTSINSVPPPYNIFVCNVYGNFCTLVATINNPVPTSIYITLPPQYDTVPLVGIKIVNSGCCESFEIVNCSPYPTPTPTPPCTVTDVYLSASIISAGGAIRLNAWLDSGLSIPYDMSCGSINVSYRYVDRDSTPKDDVYNSWSGTNYVDTVPSLVIPPISSVCIFNVENGCGGCYNFIISTDCP
jgi:hypothetical protein